jgi:hypothetical protein
MLRQVYTIALVQRPVPEVGVAFGRQVHPLMDVSAKHKLGLDRDMACV